MNFKRGRPKNRRAGCLMCKPWKVNGAKGAGRDLCMKHSDFRRAKFAAEAIKEARA